MSSSKRYPVEVRQRAVRLVLEHRGEYQTEWAAICLISGKIGCSAETLRGWVRRTEVDSGSRSGLTTVEAERIKDLERENKELRRANAHPNNHPKSICSHHRWEPRAD
jgi:transposase-like protein